MKYQGQDGKEYYFHTFIPKYKKNSNNPKEEELHYSLNNDFNSIDLKIKRFYNSKSKITSETIFYNKNKEGVWQNINMTEYIYDKKNNLIKTLENRIN